MPELALARDLGRARRALGRRDWEGVARICRDILRDTAAEHPEALRLLRRVALHRGLRRGAWAAAAVAATFLCYLLSLPPVARAIQPPFAAAWRVFYRPAWRCYDAGPLSGVLKYYHAAWGRPDLAACFALHPSVASPAMPPPVTSADLQRLQEAYTQQRQDLAAEQRRDAEAWPKDYVRDLDTLMERRRATGDFEGWAVTQDEQKQFRAGRQIGDSPAGELAELAQLKRAYRERLAAQRLDRCRRLVTASKKYINDLTDLQRTLTRESRMETAAAVNAEIRRVQGDDTFLEAEASLAAAAGPVTPVTGAGLPAPADQIAELAPLRQRCQEQIEGSARDLAQKQEEWPDKYIAALKALMEQFRQQGSYTEWEKAKSELDRFEVDRAILPKDLVPEPARLAKLQRDHLDLLAQYRRVRATSVIQAADAFLHKLEEMQKKFTQQGNMDLAAQVNAEIKQVRGGAEYTGARQELAPPPPPAGEPATNRPTPERGIFPAPAGQ